MEIWWWSFLQNIRGNSSKLLENSCFEAIYNFIDLDTVLFQLLKLLEDFE